MSESAIATIISVVATLIVGWGFFFVASKELRNEAARLRHLNKLILHALEHAGFAEVKRDGEGEPIGIVLSAVGNLKSQPATMGMQGTVKPSTGTPSAVSDRNAQIQ